MNFLILTLHTTTISLITLLTLRFGKETMIAWLSLLVVAMNLFILKQITLFGLNITCCDALAVGYLLGLNLIQEFFGREWARKTVWISFAISCAFLLLAQFQLAYTPNSNDSFHSHFSILLTPLSRLVIASLLTFLIVQFLDIKLFGYLRSKSGGKQLTLRVVLSLCLSQTLDTVLFSFLGLYKLVPSLADIILFSLAAKLLVIALSSPFVTLSRKLHVSV